MKVTYVLFLMVGWAALSGSTGHAAETDEPKHQENAKPSDQQPGNRGASVKSQPRRTAVLVKANRPVHHVAPGGTSAVSHARPVRPPSASRPSVPAPSNVHHRGPNPATIGGAANSAAANSGAINGTRISRKP